jgi:signal transduction histidine kinase
MSLIGHMRAIGARPLLLGGALLGIVIVSALAVRESMRVAQERKAAAERTVKDYAMFASYLYATRGYLFARDRANLAYVAFHLDQPYTRAELPALSAIPAVPDSTERCGPRWSIYRFRIDLPERTVQYGQARPDPTVAGIIQDSIPKLANAEWVKGSGFGYLFVDAPRGRESISYARALDSANNVIAVYGYRSCYGVRDTMDYSRMYKVVRVLPPMMPGYSERMTSVLGVAKNDHSAAILRSDTANDEDMRGTWPWGMPADSLLTLTVTDAQGRQIFRAPPAARTSDIYGISPLRYIGNVRYRVSLRPDVARFLVAGGIPESRVPASVILLIGSIILAIAGFASLRSEIRLVNSRQRFLANVSHELRTPLQQILMFVQLIRLGRTRTDEERERSLEIIERETNRLIALSNSVLAVAKPELQLQSAPVDVVHVAETAADFFTPLAEARKMRIVLDVPEPAVARGDPGAVRQILINVLDNAAKYGPIGQTITIGVRNEEGAVRLWVDDCGPGIPLSERNNVWKPFVRLGGTLDDSTGGAGLGLSIVRDLATAMDATVDLAQRPTGGTRFTLNLQRSRNGSAQ